MIEFLRFIYVGFIFDAEDITERVILFFLNLVIIIVTLVIGTFLIDYLYKIEHVENLKVLSKEYTSDYYYPVLIGKVTTMQYSPEYFELHFNGVSCTVSEVKYLNTNINDSFTVKYYTGLTDTKYCISVKDLK